MSSLGLAVEHCRLIGSAGRLGRHILCALCMTGCGVMRPPCVMAMAALTMTLTAMFAAADGYVELPRHQSMRILLGVRFQASRNACRFRVEGECEHLHITYVICLVIEKGDVSMSHNALADMDQPIRRTKA